MPGSFLQVFPLKPCIPLLSMCESLYRATAKFTYITDEEME